MRGTRRAALLIGVCLGLGLDSFGASAEAASEPFLQFLDAWPGYEVGGSNYLTTSVGNYLVDPVAWNTDLKLVIGHYHRDPELVRRQLQEMYDRGQRKVALMLWHMCVPANVPDNVSRHVVIACGGSLPLQQRENVEALAGLIRDIGFNELQFRFAPQWTSRPGDWLLWDGDTSPGGTVWTAWDESKYQENWNLIVNTRAIVEGVLAGSRVRRVYDLAVEHGGFTHGKNPLYLKRLWQDYTFISGLDPKDTVGFSIAVAPGRMGRLIDLYDSTGHRAPMYAVDVYGDAVYKQLSWVAAEMASRGEKAKPLIVQETHYNHPTVFQAVHDAQKDLDLNIRYIMQWPLEFGAVSGHFSMHYPAANTFYGIAKPVISAAGSGCPDRNCLWILGKEFASNAYVKVFFNRKRPDGTPDKPEFARSYHGTSLRRSRADGKDVLTLRLATSEETSEFAANGLLIQVVNQFGEIGSDVVSVTR